MHCFGRKSILIMNVLVYAIKYIQKITNKHSSLNLGNFERKLIWICYYIAVVLSPQKKSSYRMKMNALFWRQKSCFFKFTDMPGPWIWSAASVIIRFENIHYNVQQCVSWLEITECRYTYYMLHKKRTEVIQCYFKGCYVGGIVHSPR